MESSKYESLLKQNETLKQQIHSLKNENTILHQKINYLNQLCAENTMNYRNIQSSNNNLQIQFEFNEKSFKTQQLTAKRECTLLLQRNQNLTKQLEKLKAEHNLTIQENNKYQKHCNLFNETCKENEKLYNQSNKYEKDLKSIQKQYTKEINVLKQTIDDLSEQLEAQSDNTPIAINLQNIHSISFQPTDLNSDKPMIRPILSNSITNYSNSITNYSNSKKVRIYNHDSNRMLSMSTTYRTPTDNERKLIDDAGNSIYAEVPDIDYDCLQVLNEETFDFDTGITKGNYNILYPFLCKVFIENTGCCRVPNKFCLEAIILKYGGKKTNENVVTINENSFTNFWQWFKECCTIIKELKYLWDINEPNLYLCNLFCGREQSKQILTKQGKGTFILRLATSRKGSIVFTYYEQMSSKIVHSLYVRKGTNQYISEKSNIGASKPQTIAEIVRAGKSFRFLYTPRNIHPKNNVF